MGIETLLVNVGYATHVGATACRDLLRFRVVLAVSSLAFLGFGLVVDIPSVVVWNIAFSCFNGWRIATMVRDGRSLGLSQAERRVSGAVLAELRPHDVAYLWKLGWPELIGAGDRVVQRQERGDLILVVEGAIDLRAHGRIAARLGPATLATEPLGLGADMVAVAVGPTAIRRWTRQQLDHIERARPHLAATIWRLTANPTDAPALDSAPAPRPAPPPRPPPPAVSATPNAAAPNAATPNAATPNAATPNAMSLTSAYYRGIRPQHRP